MKKKEQAISNTKIAVVFFVFLSFAVGISLIFKVITLIREGQFDGSKRFTLSLTNGSNTQVISLLPSSRNIAVFKLNGAVSSSQAGKLLEIPIDGFVTADLLNFDQKISPLFTKTVFNYNKLKTNLTMIDLARLAMFARTVPESFVKVKTIGNASGLELDKIVGRLAADDLIEKDNQTIQIVNATDIVGLGNRLARLITNMGGDVIIVATGDSLRKKSVISYIDKKTYTVERLQKVLGYKTVKEAGNAISDITIIIGEDRIDSNPF